MVDTTTYTTDTNTHVEYRVDAHYLDDQSADHQQHAVCVLQLERWRHDLALGDRFGRYHQLHRQFRVSAFANGYEHYRAITISHTQVAANQTNFPVLVTGTFPYLATLANGGFLQNANGYDAIFTSDMAGSNLLNWEVEQYSPVDGTATYWVKVPNLSSTTDTTIYLYYDNPAITTFQGNKTGTWDSNFIAVYHASDNAANQTVSDSTGQRQ